MRSAPLNIFQRTQRLWDTLHPYNAAQAMELASPHDADAIAAAFNRAVDDLRLGEFVVTGGRYTIEPRRGDVELIRSDQPLAPLLTEQMNRPFDAQRSMPFRPFVCREENGAQAIGLIYQHWPADSVSIRMLMRQWLLRLIDHDAPPVPIALPEGGLFHYFGSPIAGWSLMQQTWEIFGFSSRMKRMRRIECPSAARDVEVFLRRMRTGLIHAIHGRARREGYTVGDVFVAALAEACSKHGPNAPTDRRPDLALGTIVDLRGRASRVPKNVFGLFLGFTTSIFAYDTLYRFDALLKSARRQRLMHVCRRSAEASQLNLTIGLAIARALRRPGKLLEFYRKRLALSGGISNVNLTHDWAGELHPSVIRRYHRASPIGPMMPLVITPTTLGEELSVCCTFRRALAPHGRPTDVLAAFEDRLHRYAGI